MTRRWIVTLEFRDVVTAPTSLEAVRKLKARLGVAEETGGLLVGLRARDIDSLGGETTPPWTREED